MAADWIQARRQFPVLDKWVYLNSATFGPLPLCAVEAANRHWRHRDEQACIDFLDWFTDADRVRAKAAQLIGAQPADIAFVPSAGAALSWLMQGIDWKPGDQVLALAHEFPNNLYYPLVWRERQVEFIEMPLPQGRFELDAFLSLLTNRTRLVLLSTVNYSTGLRPPLEQIGAALRERRASARCGSTCTPPQSASWRCTPTNGCSRRPASASPASPPTFANGLPPRSIAGAAIRTGATSISYTTARRNCPKPPCATKGAS
jgi:hypothetical protein